MGASVVVCGTRCAEQVRMQEEMPFGHVEMRTGLLRREARGSQRSLDFRTSRCHKGRGEWPWWRVSPAVQSVAASEGRDLKFKAPALLPTILILQVWGGAQHLCLKKLSR